MPINFEDTFTLQVDTVPEPKWYRVLGFASETPSLGEGEVTTYTTPTDSERYCPEKILRSGNRTIVFWNDGTKTIVKRSADEADNDYAAFTAALAIKIFGSNSRLKRMIFRKTDYQMPKKKKKEGKEANPDAPLS